MVVGRIARGILILILVFWSFLGFVAGAIGGLVLILICGVIYWVLQLVNLYKQIHITWKLSIRNNITTVKHNSPSQPAPQKKGLV